MSKDVLLDVVSREMERVAKNSDNWQERMNALVEMQRAFESLDNITGGNNVSADVWRALKPLKGVIQDLRSQIVKEVCALLVTISKTTRDAMVPFLREILQSLIDVRGGGNKVCGNYCGECLETMVSYTVVKGPTLRFFVDLMLESKNKMIRLSCITCMKLAVVNWSAMHDKSDVQQLEKALKNALYDASSSCRSESNEFFLVFQQSFSKRAALLMTMLDYKVQKRLEALNEAGRPTPTDLADAPAGAIPTYPRKAGPGTADNSSITDGGIPTLDQSGSLDLGDRVCIPDKELFGFVRYVGEVDGTKGAWIGVELDEPYGKNDGSVKGKYYFRCKPKHGVFARQHQMFLTIAGNKLREQVARQHKADESLPDETIAASEGQADVNGLAGESVHDQTKDAAPGTAAEEEESAAQLDGQEEASKLSLVLLKASATHRRYLMTLLQGVRSELVEHERFANYAATASSADAVQYLQQLQNCAQEKIVLSDVFIQQIIQAQQTARES